MANTPKYKIIFLIIGCVSNPLCEIILWNPALMPVVINAMYPIIVAIHHQLGASPRYNVYKDQQPRMCKGIRPPQR
jgi:hypothetical protein